MSNTQKTRERVTVEVENIGGITRSDVSFEKGVAVLTGRNATNRTSFLRAVMAALGSDDVSLKGDADEGSVRLEIGEETYTRRLVRQGRTVALEGNPYLDDSEPADLFAFLLESNAARRAVRTSGDLREIIMRPIDTAEIRENIEAAKRRKRETEERIEELRDHKGQLPELEEQRRSIEDEIGSKRDELAAVREHIEEADASVEATRAAKEEFERTLDELNDERSELQQLESKLESRRRDLEELESDRDRLRAELESIEPPSEDRLSELDRRLSATREEKQAVDATVNELGSIIRFNRNTLDDADAEVFAALGSDEQKDRTEAVTDRLVDDGVTCWTCGSAVDRSRIEATLEQLQELRERKMERRSALDDDIDDLKQERAELQERRRQRQQVREKLEYVESEIESRSDAVASLHEQRTEAQQRVEELEAEVESFELDGREEILERHTEANRLEFEIERLESDLDDVEAEIERIEAEVDDLEELKDRRDRLRDEIEELRTRIDRIVETAVEEFNTHMATVLDVLEYRNLDRVWLERQRSEGDDEATFDLHVVRTTEDGTSYEDRVDHLSESEREVVGLVFGLAGYLAHDVHEEVPFMILDSLEAIDGSRLAALTDYLEQFPDYLLVALLPEDAAALDGGYTEIRDV